MSGFLQNDVDSLMKRVKQLEANEVAPQLLALRKSMTAEFKELLISSQKSLVSNILDVILAEDKTAIKQLRQELEITAGQATKSANDAKAIAQVEIDASIELLRAKSYVFAHSEG